MRSAQPPGGTTPTWSCRLYLAEDAGKTKLYNACVLLDRQGKVAGIYRKVYPVASGKANRLEGGVLPGKNFPVFSCDFGKVGMQICYDMFFDAGWEALAHKGAELVIWPTQSPQIIGAQCRAHRHHYYIVSSTWRNNISLVDPTGAVIAQQTKEPGLLVEQIDLSYVLLDWQPQLRNGQPWRSATAKRWAIATARPRTAGSSGPTIPRFRSWRWSASWAWSCRPTP